MGVLEFLRKFKQISYQRIGRGVEEEVGQENNTGIIFLVETRIQKIVRKKDKPLLLITKFLQSKILFFSHTKISTQVCFLNGFL